VACDLLAWLCLPGRDLAIAEPKTLRRLLHTAARLARGQQETKINNHPLRQPSHLRRE
jgi:hypothetical protein